MKLRTSLSILLAGSILLTSGCARKANTDNGGFLPILKGSEITLSLEEMLKIRKFHEQEPELIGKLQKHSLTNSEVMKEYNKHARKHNADKLRKYGVPEEQVQATYPEPIPAEVNKDGTGR